MVMNKKGLVLQLIILVLALIGGYVLLKSFGII